MTIPNRPLAITDIRQEVYPSLPDDITLGIRDPTGRLVGPVG